MLRSNITFSWGVTLSAESYNTLTSFETPLRITGYFQEQNKNRVTYYYKYNSWVGHRPADVPEFVPCDFIMSRAIITPVILEPLSLTSSADTSGPSKEKPSETQNSGLSPKGEPKP
jgi:hypothetical protein